MGGLVCVLRDFIDRLSPIRLSLCTPLLNKNSKWVRAHKQRKGPGEGEKCVMHATYYTTYVTTGEERLPKCSVRPRPDFLRGVSLA